MKIMLNFFKSDKSPFSRGAPKQLAYYAYVIKSVLNR